MFSLLWPADSRGEAPDRRNWLVDQLSQEPVADSRGLHRYQATIGWVNYADTSSFQFTGLVNLTLFEVRLRASQRWFLASSDRGRLQRQTLESEKTTLGLELGRQYLTPSGHFGRLGVEALKFLPNGHWTFRAGFDTGIIESASNRWRLQTQLHLYLNPPGGGTLYRIQARFLRKLSENTTGDGVLLGGFFAWNYRSNPIETIGEHEHMLFSMGPSVEYIAGASVLRAFVPIRIWMDRKISAGPSSTLITYFPVEITVPDINLTWSLVF
jgi:hypothetical protein